MTGKRPDPAPQFGRRRVPARLYRKFMNGLTPAARREGDATGYSMKTYQTNRDGHYRAVDAALDAQLVELRSSLTEPGADTVYTAFLNLRHSMWDHRQRQMLGHGSRAALAERADASHARLLATTLRRLADQTDALAIGLELRAEDHDNDQAITDWSNGTRG